MSPVVLVAGALAANPPVGCEVRHQRIGLVSERPMDVLNDLGSGVSSSAVMSP